MKDSGSVHQHVQEMCDCYSTTDPLKEMSTLPNDRDKQSAAAKWIALAALHGVNNNADKVTIRRDDDGRVTVVAEYRPTELPSPGPEAADAIFGIFREITHIEDDKGKMTLALGIRDSSIDLGIKIKRKQGSEKITIGFPGK